MEGLLAMNNKERERLKILVRLENKLITQKIAAEQLRISVRQLQRLSKKYADFGEKGIISLKRGKPSNNQLNVDKEKIIQLITEKYHDFGPTLIQEKLGELHDLQVSISWIRKLMIEKGIWKSRKLKPLEIHRRREPREHLGELVQMDGSYHDWFEGRAPKCCLIVLIDDATSRIMWLQFVRWETCFGYFNAIKAYINRYGKPLSLYTDRHAVFETTRESEKKFKETQFHRAMSTLGIDLILANSPQAKGRVERVNGTLQDRLVKEMRLARISSMEEGNAFLSRYIKSHNEKFAKVPKSSLDAHRPVEEKASIDTILCLHHERKVAKDLTISFKGKIYQITELGYKYKLRSQKVVIVEQEMGDIRLFHEGKELNFKLYEELPKAKRPMLKIKTPRNEHKVGEPWHDHPWKVWRGKRMVI